MEVQEYTEFKSKLIKLRRVARVMKGGKRFRLSALVAVGNGNGKVGVALGKAQETAAAIKKAEERAKRRLIDVPIVNGTIPHEVIGRCGAARILIKPAGPGTGVRANLNVRVVLELAGIKNVIAKSLGSNNVINLIWATLDALSQLRTKDEIMEARFKPIEEEEHPPKPHKLRKKKPSKASGHKAHHEQKENKHETKEE